MTRLQKNKNTVSSRAKPRDLSKSILQTLKYSDHFDFPLTLEELHSRLIRTPISQIGLTHQIRLMLKTGTLAQSGNYYHLPGRSSLVTRRLSRAKLSVPQLSRARSLSSLLSSLSSILAIFLTGSLAMSNSHGNSDIDFMIITKNNRLWTTRLFLTIYTTILGLRRTPHSQKNFGKLCLNLYLSPISYLLPPAKRSLYTAYELIQAVPLYDPSDTRSALLAANPWIHDYLPNFPLPSPTGSDPEGSAQPRPQHKRGGSDPIGTFIESICYHLQYLYMKNKITREYITKDAAFFHPHDPGKKVLKLIH